MFLGGVAGGGVGGAGTVWLVDDFESVCSVIEGDAVEGDAVDGVLGDGGW